MLDSIDTILEMITDEDLALAASSLKDASQIHLEMLFSKYQLTETIRQAFIDMGAVEACKANEIPVAFGLDLMTQIYLHKRAKPATLVGILRHHFKDQENPAQACADAIVEACKKDVLSCTQIRTLEGELEYQLVVEYLIPAEIQAKLDRFQYPLPMIEPPREVTGNRQTGYQTIQGSLILKKNHHDEDICLDHINRVNAQQLKLNPDIVAFVQNQWKNIDKPKEGETIKEFRQRRKAFDKYNASSKDVIEALLLQEPQTGGFWLTHRYDKRGRTYSQGYHVNYQGNDWNKACIEFAQAEPLNEE